MILSYDEVCDIADEIANDMPEVFYEELTSGVIVTEEEYPDPVIPGMYVMGEYCVDELGKYICLYYGSFARVLAEEPREKWVEELDHTLRHEFTHHMEDMAGTNKLDIKDAEFLARSQEELEMMDLEELFGDEN